MVGPAWVLPRTVDEALEALDAADGARPIAGGTDLAVEVLSGSRRPPVLVDLGRIEGLAAIKVDRPAPGVERVGIGAAATHSAIAAHPLVRERAAVLAAACGAVGGRQIRERGTVGGNVANASPAADSAVALLALDASVRVRSAGGGDGGVGTDIPLGAFLLGPGETVMKPGELIVSVAFGCPEAGSRSAYRKVGLRRALAIAVVSVAVVFEPSAGRVRIAVGSAAPAPFRAHEAEELLASEWRAARDRTALVAEAARLAAAAARPIDDLRASAHYRRVLVEALTRTTIAEIC